MPSSLRICLISIHDGAYRTEYPGEHLKTYLIGLNTLSLQSYFLRGMKLKTFSGFESQVKYSAYTHTQR